MIDVIAFFLPGLTGGGVERMALNLSETLVAEGHEVDLVVTNGDGELRGEVPPGVNLVDLSVPLPLLALPGLVRYLRRRRPTAMFSGITSVNLAAIAARWASRAPTRLVVSERVSVSDNVRTHPLKRLLPPLMRLLYPRADAVVAVSDGLADDVAEAAGLDRAQVQVVRNPVVTPELSAKLEATVDHPWLNEDRRDRAVPVIVGVGRLVQQKDFTTLIRAFAEVRGRREARLVIVGEGPERADLEALATDLGVGGDVDLVGFTPEAVAYVARADVFVLSSLYEGFGNVVVEALHAGCPVVSTDCPYGPAEILADGKYGELVQPDRPSEMAEAIERTLDDSPDRSILQERAAEYSVENVAPTYLHHLLGPGPIEP